MARRDRFGQTPLHWAYAMQRNESKPEIIEFLLTSGADSTIRDRWGLAPEDWALPRQSSPGEPSASSPR